MKQPAERQARKALMQQGEVWAAYDLARSALEGGASDPDIALDAVLCLARSGAANFAADEFRRLGLDRRPDRASRALWARLLKDLALRRRDKTSQSLAREAAQAYQAVYETFGGVHALVNQAMLTLLSGDEPPSAEAARRVLSLDPPGPAASELDQYYDLAARAEASLVLREPRRAEAFLNAASAHAPGERQARISTLRQLERIAAHFGEETSWMSPLRPRPVGHYTGHIYCAGVGHENLDEADLKVRMTHVLAEAGVDAVYGGLAAGGDILWAEAALAAGIALNVVLPMNRDAYLRRSVAAYGLAWLPRYDACLAAAATLRFSSLEDDLGDDEAFIYGARYAMGCAAADAELKATAAVQLVLREAGCDESRLTGQDAGWWARTGRPWFEVAAPSDDRARARPVCTDLNPSQRTMHTMLFVDFKGFGRLDDAAMPAFFDVVMGEMSSALTALEVGPDHVETWGDGVFLVFREPADAAQAALAILDRHSALDLEASGLPADLGVRIGGHYGPIRSGQNPITGGPSFIGAHVVAAARIEPDAPPGSAYVSEALAGVLAACHSDRFRCGYVGMSKTRKGSRPLPLFSLGFS